MMSASQRRNFQHHQLCFKLDGESFAGAPGQLDTRYQCDSGVTVTENMRAPRSFAGRQDRMAVGMLGVG
eukprot:181448-Hanusia_phi.AAC.1